MCDITLPSKYRSILTLYRSNDGALALWGMPYKTKDFSQHDGWVYLGGEAGSGWYGELPEKETIYVRSLLAWLQSQEPDILPTNPGEWTSLSRWDDIQYTTDDFGMVIPHKVRIAHPYKKFATLSNNLGLWKFLQLIHSLGNYGSLVKGSSITAPDAIRYLINSHLLIPIRCLVSNPITYTLIDYEYKTNFHTTYIASTLNKQRCNMYERLAQTLQSFSGDDTVTCANVYQHDLPRAKSIRHEITTSIDEMVDKLDDDVLLDNGIVEQVYLGMMEDIAILDAAITVADKKLEHFTPPPTPPAPIRRVVSRDTTRTSTTKVKPDLSMDSLAEFLKV